MIAERKFLTDYINTLKKFVCSAPKEEIRELYSTEVINTCNMSFDVDDVLDRVNDIILSIIKKR